MKLILIVLTAFCLPLGAVLPEEPDTYQIEFNIEESQSQLFVQAYFMFDETVKKLPEWLSYYLVAEGISKENGPNIFKSKSNFFNPYKETGQAIGVLKMEIRDTLLISLKIKNGSTLVARKKLTWIRPEPLPVTSNKNPKIKQNRKNLSDIEIDGLIIDQTKTKAGRDFYELFYSNWVAPQQASDFTILIAEEPARGRSTIVSVKINEELVFRQFLQSRYEIIEQLMFSAVQVTGNRLIQLEEIKNQIEEGDQMGNGIF